MKHVAGEIEIREEPIPPCPKCGSQSGWTGPTYRRNSRVVVSYRFPDLVVHEWLAFACIACGYERPEATKDAPPPLPDPAHDYGVVIRACGRRDGRPWWRVWR